eukprot:TRINITY_DN17834_c0_g1_i1.p1 TRINITY_DN17834_c0_g1~~TRINITY_DN17834_c0_g1_i1.p1  ORF type:complete len:351 (-),score=39.19 TRINITY_DN17834_c0_g1_i1:145-1197(-)
MEATAALESYPKCTNPKAGNHHLQTKPHTDGLRVLAFLGALGYIQGTCLAGLFALLLGYVVPRGSLAAHYLWLLQTQFSHTPRSCHVLDDTLGPVIFLANHRSWGDFWVDAALLGAPSFVARWLVAAAVPFTAAWGHFGGWLWFFKRDQKHAAGTTQWMQHFLQSCHQYFPSKGVVMYPEGTRSLLSTSLPLKKGGLAAAFNLGWPVQAIITSNKEHVMAERALSVGFGTRCVTSVSVPLFPRQFTCQDAFLKAVMALWQETWDDAYKSVSIPRDRALLPGAVSSFAGFSLRGPPRLQVLRILLGLLGLLLLRRYWVRHGPQLSDIEQFTCSSNHDLSGANGQQSTANRE